MDTPQNRINVQTFIDSQRFSNFQWLIFVLCFVVALLDGFDTAAIGYLAPSLIQQFGASKPALAPVLSAALFGLACGALTAGPLADRLGRRRVLIGSTTVMGVFSLAAAFAGSLDHLVVLRFFTGLGLGAAMPNAATMISEYCPTKIRATLVGAMFCGFPLGSSFGGFLAAWMIPHWGWQSVLVLGGVVPLALAVGLIAILPESVRFMVVRQHDSARIAATLGRIAPDASLQGASFFMTETKAAVTGQSGLGVVLSRSFRIGSVMLWMAYFMGLVIFYALINWMPVLFKEAGMDQRTATLISALFPLGGVGAILCGWLMARFNGNYLIALGFIGTAVFVYLIGLVTGQMGWLMLMVFIGGALQNTAQTSLPALAAAFYPTQGRATGVAWMLGIGRFGGIVGTFWVGELQRRHVSIASVFALVAIPGIVAALALAVKQWAHPEHRDVQLTDVAPGH
jgi:AAHS family 4-hydroxybenzoate transporter-like MFS transporter